MTPPDPMTAAAPPGASPASPARARPPLRSVALPAEHGGWGLTLEPVLLGLLVAPSVAGMALGAAAVVAFAARTPLKLVLVDRGRHRRLTRTVLAERFAVAELVVLAGSVTVAAVTARGAYWVPLVCAIPLAVVELWYDMRSRSRRLVPELAGTLAIGSVVAAMVLADGGAGRLAVGLWFVVAARAVASVPFVRLQLARARQKPHRTLASDGAQAAALALSVVAAALDHQLRVAPVVALVLVAGFHVVAARRDPPVATVLGVQQVVLGLMVVLASAVGVRAS